MASRQGLHHDVTIEHSKRQPSFEIDQIVYRMDVSEYNIEDQRYIRVGLYQYNAEPNWMSTI